MRDIWLSIKDVGKGIVAFALRFGLVLMFFVLSGALVFYFLDEQRLTLTSPILPPHVMAAWCIAASILLFVHFSTQSRAFATIFGNSLHFQILGVLTKTVLVFAGLVLLIVSLLNPVFSPRVFILIDHDSVRGAHAAPEMLKELVKQEKFWQLQRIRASDIYIEPKRDPSGKLTASVERIVSGAIATPDAAQLLSQIQQLNQNTVPTEIRVRELADTFEKEGRAGDQIIVVSTLRNPPLHWALNGQKFGSRWINVSGKARDYGPAPSIRQYQIWHYPGLVPQLEIEFDLPPAKNGDVFSPPRMSAFLTDNPTEDCEVQTSRPHPFIVKDVGAPSEAFQGSLKDYGEDPESRVQIGDYQEQPTAETSPGLRRVAYVLNFPTGSPDYLCVQLDGKNWEALSKGADQNSSEFSNADVLRLPKFRTPIPVFKRQLTISYGEGLAAEVQALLGSFDDSTRSAVARVTAGGVTVVGPSEQRTSNSLALLFDADNSPSKEWSLELTSLYEDDPNGVQFGRLVFPKASARAGHQGNFSEAPDCSRGALGREVIQVFALMKSDQDCRVVLGRDSNGVIFVAMPNSSTLEKYKYDQKVALKTLFVYALNLVWRESTGTRQLANTFVSDQEEADVVPERTTGWRAEDRPIVKQLFEALILGRSDGREGQNASNGARPRLLAISFSLMAAAFLIGGVSVVRQLLVRLMSFWSR